MITTWTDGAWEYAEAEGGSLRDLLLKMADALPESYRRAEVYGLASHVPGEEDFQGNNLKARWLK